ncbi:uncharacterized protein LOC115245167 [Formica exsecta]|uniref:uncharacterized protein LOC115245167 n=1 Tax=Formica exsecta TaxID=72781 RepID=UPI0011423A36|nr:uncharacterized protein LOC115245167 [Formica exsecta]
MDPLQFDKMSTEKLKAETRRYRLPSTDDRNKMIEQLLAHYESNSPAVDLLSQRQATQVQEEHTGVAMNALATAITNQMQQMQQAMLQQHLQQQELLRQLLQPLTRDQQQERANQGSSYQSRQPRSEAPSPSSQGQSQHSAISAAPSTHAVSMLASQIPEFGGQEDENVDLWVKRVEQVSRIHGAHEDITFLASTTRNNASNHSGIEGRRQKTVTDSKSLQIQGCTNQLWILWQTRAPAKGL